MKRLTVCAVALLAGCATPGELIQTGEKSEHRLARAPELATACMVRNLEQRYDRSGMMVRPLDGGGSELVVGAMLVAHAMPNAGGSRVTVWLRPEPFYRRADVVPDMVKGC